MRRDQNLASGRAKLRRDLFFADGRVVTVNDVRELKTTVVTRNAAAKIIRDPKSGCLNSVLGKKRQPRETADGEGTTAGFRVFKIRSDRLVADYAAELGCALLHVRAGTGPAYEVKELVDVIPGEPDAALFDIPSRYEEASPSAVAGADPNSPHAKEADRRYQVLQRNPVK
jgi:hypothetical protein